MPKRTPPAPEKKVEVPILEPEEQDGQPVATESHTVVRQYARKVKVKPEEDPPEEEFEELEELEEPEEELDPVQLWLRNFDAGNGGNWEMVVYELPNYPRDTRTNSTARIRMGKRPFNPQSFEDEIAIEFAKVGSNNWFLVEVRNNGTIKKTLPAMCIMPASYEEYLQRGLPPPALPSLAAAAAPPVAVVDPIRQLRDTFALAKEAREAFGPDHTPPPAAAPALANDGLSPEERALAVMLGRNEKVLDKLSNGIVGKLFGEAATAGSTSTADLVKTGLEVLPTVVEKFFEGMRSLRTDAPQEQPAKGQASNEEEPPIELVLLDQMVRALALKMPPSAAAGIIESYEAAFPELTEFIGKFLATPPAAVLGLTKSQLPDSASILNQPHAAQWVEELQNELRGGYEEREQAQQEEQP